jgi:glycosyltransferase involved in cell wall biosynthesis
MTDVHRTSTNANVMIDARYLCGVSSGIGRYTEQLISNLLEIDDQIRLTLVTHPDRPVPVESPRVTCQVQGAPPNSLRTRFSLAGSLNFQGVDLFHSPFNFLPRELPVPSIVTLHDIMWLIDPRYCTASRLRRAISGTFYGHVIPASVAEAKTILTVSHTSRLEIEEYFPSAAGRVHVTYNGLDPFFYDLDMDEAWDVLERFVPRGAHYVLVVGQGSPYKNHEGAVRAFIEAFADDPEMHLVLVRRFERGPAHELNQLLSDPRIASRVIRQTYVSGPELRALYRGARVFLFPSLYEGFGLPALEAMACGTPVVCSDHGAPAEVCGPGALTAPARDVGALADALRRVHCDLDLRAKIISKGLDHSRGFTWRKCAEGTLEVIRSIL